MKHAIAFLFLFLAAGTAVLAQRQQTIFGAHGFRFSGIWGAWNNNYTFYEDDRGFHSGGNIGLEFGRSVFVGYAWSNLKDQIDIEGSNASFRLKQKNAVLAIIPNSYAVVHPMIKFQTGPGRVKLNDGESDRVFIFQPSAGIEINVFKWFHLGLEGGYRFVTDSDLPIPDNSILSAPFAQLNLRVGISWGCY